MMLVHQVAALALTIAASGLALSGPRGASQTGEPGDSLRPATDVHLDAGCPVRGVWELVSVSQDGKDQPLAGSQVMKVLTDRHFMFVGQAAKRDTLPLETALDTLRAYQISGGAGTYTTSGTTYVEHLDIFVIPSWIGTSFTATCRVEGDLWYHSFTEPNDTTAGPGPYQHVVEVWRRLE